MSTSNVEETLPARVKAAQRQKTRWGLWLLAGFLTLAVSFALGGYLGYRSAVKARLAKQQNEIVMNATVQFQLALQDMDAKRYDRAQSRLEYVVQLDPNFPGALEKLSQAMLAANLAKTPTVAPTPTPVPTPDLRGVEALLADARQKLANKEWDAAIQTLDALRKENRNYQVVAVDDMYYLALRNRGVDKILKGGDLEGGLYDLAVAERFGPIDAEANSYRTWARIYLTGASYWAVDWEKVVYYFSQVGPALPNLRDGSGITAFQRYRDALIGYGDQLAKAGDYCKAKEQYDKALQLGGAPQNLQPTADYAGNQCSGGPPQEHQATPTPETQTPAAPTPTEQPGATPTSEAPTPLPSPTNTAKPPEPTQVARPTPTPG